MERLTKRYEHYDIIDLTARTNTNCSVICNEMSDCESCPVNVALSKLADYEDAEEQGLLLRLPCKVGDTVWLLGEKFILDYEVRRILVSEYGIEAVHIAKEVEGVDRWNSFYAEDIGKAVFLTKEEAEAALAEKGGTE